MIARFMFFYKPGVTRTETTISWMEQGREYEGVWIRIASADVSPLCTHSQFMTAVTPLTASFKEALSGGVMGSLETGGPFSRGYIEVFP